VIEAAVEAISTSLSFVIFRYAASVELVAPRLAEHEQT